MTPATINNTKKPMKQICRSILFQALVGVFFLFLGSTALSADSSPRTVYVAGSGSAPLDQHIMSLFQAQLGDNYNLIAISDTQAVLSRKSPIVSIGPSAFSRVWQANGSTPILALLVDKAFIDIFYERSPGQVTGIFYDVPLLRQALLGKVILPHATKVALLATQDSVEQYEGLTDQLADYNIRARVFLVDDQKSIIPTLTRALGYGDFLLATPDNEIYNPGTIKHILLTAYRRNKIVIGPNQAYVKAGSLASEYAPFSGMVNMAIEFINDYFETGQFPEPSYPNLYRAELNMQVARSLNIPLPDRKEINKAVQDFLAEREGVNQ